VSISAPLPVALEPALPSLTPGAFVDAKLLAELGPRPTIGVGSGEPGLVELDPLKSEGVLLEDYLAYDPASAAVRLTLQGISSRE
jgi:hypothetical protein